MMETIRKIETDHPMIRLFTSKIEKRKYCQLLSVLAIGLNKFKAFGKMKNPTTRRSPLAYGMKQGKTPNFDSGYRSVLFSPVNSNGNIFKLIFNKLFGFFNIL